MISSPSFSEFLSSLLSFFTVSSLFTDHTLYIIIYFFDSLIQSLSQSSILPVTLSVPFWDSCFCGAFLRLAIVVIQLLITQSQSDLTSNKYFYLAYRTFSSYFIFLAIADCLVELVFPYQPSVKYQSNSIFPISRGMTLKESPKLYRLAYLFFNLSREALCRVSSSCFAILLLSSSLFCFTYTLHFLSASFTSRSYSSFSTSTSSLQVFFFFLASLQESLSFSDCTQEITQGYCFNL